MAPRKPTWDWKARDCAEFQHFTVPFAVKEYVQNVVGQALKDLRVREWSDWTREDLRDASPKEREQRKQALVTAYPGLMTGPHGAAVKRLKAWVPWYILSTTIPQSRLRTSITTSDLQIALVVWRHTSLEIIALSVYNNHLDAKAKFSSFTVDGSSTSRHNQWAVGEKGKGFILATQFLHEWVERYIGQRKIDGLEMPKEVKEGISFRVGHQIGSLKWKKPRYPDEEDDLLQVVLDDLTPRTVDEHMEKQAAEKRAKNNKNSSDEEDDDEVDFYGYAAAVPETPKLRKTAESAMKGVYSRRATQQLDSKGEKDVLHNRGRCVVSTDEVAVTIVGLDGSFTPEYLFSAIYGIISPPQAWHDAPTDASATTKSTTKFYHRDQYVPYGLHLNRISVNYHGDLNITSDRVAILRDSRVTAYKLAVSRSADEAFRTLPDLAQELALDILSDDHSEGLAYLVRPRDKAGHKQYRTAFDAALRKLHPEIPADAAIHPTAGSTTDVLFKELEMSPLEVSTKVWEIMEASGAYITIEEHARAVLLAAPSVPDSQGLARLRVALAVVAPDVPPQHITVRAYDKSTPSVVWDKRNKLFAFALPPKCAEHPGRGACFCWVGPFLHDAAKDYDGAQLGTTKLFRAYLLCMNGEANMEADADDDDDDFDMDIHDSVHDDDDEVCRTPMGRKATKHIVISDSEDETNDGFRSSSPLRSISPPSTPRRVTPAGSNVQKTPAPRVRPPAVARRHPSPPTQSVRTLPTQSATDNASTDTLDSEPRAPSAFPAAPPVHPPAPSRAPSSVRCVLPDNDADATLASVATLVANYKDQQAALAEATAIMSSQQAEIDRFKAGQDDLSVQMEVLKIDCATHQRRIEELARAGEAKDTTIAALQATVEELKELEEQYAAAEALFLKARKKPRVD
ncbi:hypothetical protein FB451DRAFT_1561304 [Mycena latifolia]|nr:hypothetical protein FB451DRAFT_1561304 [Mycena latifolia]